MAEDRMLSDEILLGLIKKNGGGGGTTNYNLLENKPQIAGTELQGDKSLADLGIASAQDVKKEFIGTLDEWNELTTAQQKEYDTYQITDDYSEALMPNYSTTEQKTGQKWIDGKDIFVKTVNFGTLPNNTTKVVGVEIDADTVLKMEAFAIDSNSTLPIPRIAAGSNGIDLYYTYSTNSIVITTYKNMTTHNGYVTLYYTKA